jgi:hypothetical protein
VGVVLHDRAVHVGAGVALVAVGDHELDVGLGLGQERHLDAGGVAAAAAAAQAGALHHVDHAGGRHRAHRVAQGAVAAVGDVVLDPVGVDLAHVLEHHPHLAREERVLGGSCPSGRPRRRRRARSTIVRADSASTSA